MITKKEDNDETIDEDNFQNFPVNFSVQLLKGPEQDPSYILCFKRHQGDVFAFSDCFRDLFEAHYETKFPKFD